MFNDPPALTTKFVEDLESAILQAVSLSLPVSERRAFETAWNTLPDLVRKESNFEVFLRVEEGHIPDAAIRIARYWQVRQESFGDRWLLPMDQTGYGALSRDDVELYRSGAFIVLSRPSDGGLLCINDMSRCQRPSLGPSLARWLMYLVTTFGGQGPNLATQPTVLHVVSSQDRHNSLVQQNAHAVSRQALPFGKLPPKILVAQAYEPNNEHLLDFMAQREVLLEQYRSGVTPTRIKGNSVHQLVAALELQGIERDLIPAKLGGNFDYTAFDDWIRKRICIEGAMTAAPLMPNRISGVQMVVLPSLLSAKTTVLPAEADGEDSKIPANRPRAIPVQTMADSLAARKAKRRTPARRTIGVTDTTTTAAQRHTALVNQLHQQVQDLQYRNAALRKDIHRLQSWLAQARYVAALATAQQEEQKPKCN